MPTFSPSDDQPKRTLRVSFLKLSSLSIGELWFAGFKRHPLLTSLLTAILLGASITAGVLDIQRQRAEQRRLEQAREASLDLVHQLKELDRVTESLQSLMTFLDHQRSRITAEQETLARLSAEKTALEPVVRAQREVIDQIFRIQEVRIRRARWWDMALGFILGISSSIVASLILSFIRPAHPQDTASEA